MWRWVIAPIRPTIRGSIAPLSRSRFSRLLERVRLLQLIALEVTSGNWIFQATVLDLAAAGHPVGLVEHLLRRTTGPGCG